MTRNFDLRVSPRRLSVAGLYLRYHLRQRLQCRLICSTSHSILIRPGSAHAPVLDDHRSGLVVGHAGAYHLQASQVSGM